MRQFSDAAVQEDRKNRPFDAVLASGMSLIRPRPGDTKRVTSEISSIVPKKMWEMVEAFMGRSALSSHALRHSTTRSGIR